MVLFIFCFGGGVLVVVGVLWWFSSNSFEILYGSLWIEVLFFGFAGFPASLDGLANATAMVLSSSLWFLGWLWISVVSWSLELRITNILRHPPSTVGAWVWYLMLLKVDFVFLFFLLPMGYNIARWRVVQVEPLEISTIVDNGIILRGLFRLVRGGGVHASMYSTYERILWG